MKFIRNLVKLFWFAFFFGIIYLFWNTSDDSLVNETIRLSPIEYIKNIDAWNIIFSILFIGTFAGVFLILNFAVDRLLRYLSKKKPSWHFLDSGKADMWIQFPVAGFCLLIIFLVGSNMHIIISGNGKKVALEDIIEKKPVVVFGTSKMLRSGNSINKYYEYRIAAAVELFNAGKVQFFILSGDGLGQAHAPGTYNETRDMKNDLLAAGVPESMIKIDSLGLRTVDSNLRLREVFKTTDVIFVSQSFHTTRATVQAGFYGINAVSYDAKGSSTFAMLIKETFNSRPAAVFVDFMLANVQPMSGEVKFRGEFKITTIKHVGILFGLGMIIILSIIGVDRYVRSTPENRKKVMLTFSGVTLASTLFVGVMVVQVYKTLDIKFVDQLVESFAQNLGIETKKMEIKVEKEKKIEEEKAIERDKLTAKIEESVKIDSASLDSLSISEPIIDKPVAKEDKQFNQKQKKDLFNAEVDELAIKRLAEQKLREQKLADSLALVAAKPKKKNLFNSSEAPATNTFTSTKEAPQYFEAKIHGNQKFNTNDDIEFRTSKSVTVNGKLIPENFVFTAKANVFDGRIRFVLKELNSMVVKGENINKTDKSSGIPISSEFELDKGYFVSDGYGVTFSVTKN